MIEGLGIVAHCIIITVLLDAYCVWSVGLFENKQNFQARCTAVKSRCCIFHGLIAGLTATLPVHLLFYLLRTQAHPIISKAIECCVKPQSFLLPLFREANLLPGLLSCAQSNNIANKIDQYIRSWAETRRLLHWFPAMVLVLKSVTVLLVSYKLLEHLLNSNNLHCHLLIAQTIHCSRWIWSAGKIK